MVQRVAREAQRAISVIGVGLRDLAGNVECGRLQPRIEGHVHRGVVAIEHVLHGARSTIRDRGGERLAGTRDRSEPAAGVARVVERDVRWAR